MANKVIDGVEYWQDLNGNWVNASTHPTVVEDTADSEAPEVEAAPVEETPPVDPPAEAEPTPEEVSETASAA